MVASLTVCFNQLERKGKLAELTYLMNFPITEVDLSHRSLLVIVLNMYYVLDSQTLQSARNTKVFLVLVPKKLSYNVKSAVIRYFRSI